MDKSIKYKFTILGGDKRISSLAEKLHARGEDVGVCMLGDSVGSLDGMRFYSGYKKAIASCDILILPMPISRDGEHVFVSPHSAVEEIKLSDIFTCAKNCGVRYVLGGNISQKIKESAMNAGVTLVDYSMSEDFLQSNAYATAEGGVMVAMENIDTTLRGSFVLVGGYGRIAKYICKMLKSLGCRVCVAARRDETLCEANNEGYSVVNVNSNEELSAQIAQSDIIFNTVPSLIFRSEHLKKDCHATYIELASCPGGIDLKSARDTQMKIIFAPSLPGRYSPESAGGYIFDSMREILQERGIDI